MTEIHIHGPVTFITDKETPAKSPSAPPRPVRKLPTDNGGRPISKDGKPLPTDSAAKRNSRPKPKWRTWPCPVPHEAEDIVMRFQMHGSRHYMIAYRDGEEFFDTAGRLIFRSDAYPDDFLPDTVFDSCRPESFDWVPLDELLGEDE